MGWSFPYHTNTRTELVAYLKRPDRINASKYRVLRTSAVGNSLWMLIERLEDGVRFIALDLMQGGTRKDPGWGYKSLDEMAGPVAVNCPLSFLSDASEPLNESARSWRQAVEDYHASRMQVAAVELKPGRIVTYGGVDYRLEHSLGRKGWSVTRDSDGMGFRMKARQLKQALTEELERTSGSAVAVAIA